MTEPDIGILFARDPLKMSDADFLRIIQKFRESRSQFQSGVRAPTGRSLTQIEKKVREDVPDLNIALDDI